MAIRKPAHLTAWVAILAAGIILAYVIYGWLDLQNRQRDERNAEISNGWLNLQNFSQQIENTLPPVMKVADEFADYLSEHSSTIDSTALIKQMRIRLEKSPQSSGLSVTYKPYKFNQSRKHFGVAVETASDGYDTRDLTQTNYESTLWFQASINNNSSWTEPYRSRNRDIVLRYSAPFYGPTGETMGVVCVDLSPRILQSTIRNALPPGVDYGFILSPDDTFIYHPHSEWNLQNVDKLEGYETFAADFHRLREKSRFQIPDYKAAAPTTDIDQPLMFFERIEHSEWLVGIRSFDEYAANHYYNNSKLQVELLMASIAFIVIFCSALIPWSGGSSWSCWFWSIVTTVLFLAGISFIWNRSIHTPAFPPTQMPGEENVVLNDPTVLRNFLDDEENQDTKFIKTGIFIQQVQFNDAYSVMLSGYIWQNHPKNGSFYADGTPVSQGFIFAEIEPNAEVLSIEEAYREELNDSTEVVGWHFQVSVREEFDYKNYPFDQHRIWIRLWPTDFHRNVALIPDLDSYATSTPKNKPGLEKNLVLPQWNIKASYFDFRKNSYNTTFGLGSSKWKDGNNPGPAELYFNIVVQRDFLGPFFTTILPLIIVAVIVFTVLLSASKGEGGDSFLGFSGFGVVELCAAFFFIVILSQSDTMNSLQVATLIYMDYFFFLIYAMLLAVSINSILFTRTDVFWFIEYRENLIPKLLFWPLLLGSVLFFTKQVFYPLN